MEFLRYPHLITGHFNGRVFGPPRGFTLSSTWTWVGHPVSGRILLTGRPIQTRFRFGSTPEVLNLANNIHSPDHSTKGTRSPIDGLSVLVSTRFQMLFHSPPGVLFTFPSRYCSLSVIRQYLGLEGGPPIFPPGFTCPAVLWIRLARFTFRLRDSHPLRFAFPNNSARLHAAYSRPNPEDIATLGLASSAFARHYLRNLG